MSKRTLRIPTAEVFAPLLDDARYKAAYGGRGSGKSHFFAGALIEDCLREPGESGAGLRAACVREVQKSLKESAKRLIEDKLADFRLGEADGFKIFREVIETPRDGIIIFQGLQDHTAESIKSLEGFKRAWVEEAQGLSARSNELLRPTIRAAGSQIWYSWNPRLKTDPVDVLFRQGTPPTGSKVVKANWQDNPWFPSVLEQERRDALNSPYVDYDHIWEGAYASVMEGAYFAVELRNAKQEGRIGHVARDPLMGVRAVWDLGVRDATAIWVVQYVNREIRVLDYYEASGQSLGAHLEWLRSRKYQNALCVLPHDGTKQDQITAIRFEDHIRNAGFEVKTVPNQGKGAALKRIEAARKRFPQVWFNEATTQKGRDALGYYHEKRREDGSGLGPEHDWSSHGADAFGLMCVEYEEPGGFVADDWEIDRRFVV